MKRTQLRDPQSGWDVLDEPLESILVPAVAVRWSVLLHPIDVGVADRDHRIGAYPPLSRLGHQFVEPLTGIVVVLAKTVPCPVNRNKPRLPFLPPPRFWSSRHRKTLQLSESLGYSSSKPEGLLAPGQLPLPGGLFCTAADLFVVSQYPRRDSNAKSSAPEARTERIWDAQKSRRKSLYCLLLLRCSEFY